MKNEEWRDIKGFEGCYQVSNFGRVKSLPRERRLGNNIIVLPERFLSTSNCRGYKRVVLINMYSKRNAQVHRLVAEAFIPNPENKPQVNHKDENPSNNHVDNLEWVTSKENINYGTSLKRRSITERYAQPSCKRVYQYDLNGALVGEYFSLGEAERVTGFDRTGIFHCCKNGYKYKTFKGYKWSYEKEA